MGLENLGENNIQFDFFSKMWIIHLDLFKLVASFDPFAARQYAATSKMSAHWTHVLPKPTVAHIKWFPDWKTKLIRIIAFYPFDSPILRPIHVGNDWLLYKLKDDWASVVSMPGQFTIPRLFVHLIYKDDVKRDHWFDQPDWVDNREWRQSQFEIFYFDSSVNDIQAFIHSYLQWLQQEMECAIRMTEFRNKRAKIN